MRLSLVTATLAVLGTAAFAAPAAADTTDVAYLGLRGSFIVTESGQTQGTNFDYNEEYADGFGAGIYLGWVLDDSFRVEIAGDFRSADIDEVTVLRDTTAMYLPGAVVDTGGDAQIGAAMVNLYYDIHLFKGRILPWIGAGVGDAFVDYSIDDPAALFDGKDTTWVFAYQFMAGVTFPITEGFSMSVGYTYFQTQDFNYIDNFGSEQETDITQHSVDVGVQFHL